MEDDGPPGSCPDPAPRDQSRPGRRPFSRLRQVVMILVFDLGGPLLAYSLLRSAGMSAVAALGEREKKKAERSATPGQGTSPGMSPGTSTSQGTSLGTSASTGASPAPPGH